jgi:hypothetical protein
MSDTTSPPTKAMVKASITARVNFERMWLPS